MRTSDPEAECHEINTEEDPQTSDLYSEAAKPAHLSSIQCFIVRLLKIKLPKGFSRCFHS